MNRRPPTAETESSDQTADSSLIDPMRDTDTATDTAEGAPADTAKPMLIPTFWQRLRYWAWHPVSRSSLAVLLVAGLLPLLLSFTQHLSSDANATGTSAPGPIVTVPVTVSVPVTITTTPPVPTTGTAAAPAPVTIVRTTVLTTVQTTGGTSSPATTAPPPLIGPNVGTKAVICFTPATLEITATGKGVVELNVTGAATAHQSGRGATRLTVTGGTGSYAITYTAASGNVSVSWSALQGACSS